jgi:membrane protease YdiL (CAAX protease family)
MAVIVAPVAEEMIFRGYFYGVIRRYGGRIPAILISSLLFAAIHVHLPSFPGLFLLAVTLCFLYERTGSLWSNITMHAAFNASTIITLIFWPALAS